MKTLDEVIEIMEGCGLIDWGADALYYLKEYRARDRMSRRIDLEDNAPLSWDELNQMEGKPVWIEPVREWMLVTEIEEEDGAERVWLLSLDGMDYDIGSHDNWRAYRKERECTEERSK